MMLSASAQRTTLGLGTLATQNANSVAITGGTISGISNISDPGTSLPYTFSTTTTDSDPGSGIVRFNNATQNAATEIYIDDEDSDGTDVSGVIALLAGGNNPSSVLGYVTIRKEFAPENFITMKITTLTSASGYTKLVGTVEASSGATPFSDTDNLYFSIDVSGDKGDPGAGDLSGPASSTDNALVRFDGTGGSTVQNSGWTLSDANALTAGGTFDMNGYGLTVDGVKFEAGTESLPSAASLPAAVSGAQSLTLLPYSKHWIQIDGSTTLTVTSGATAGYQVDGAILQVTMDAVGSRTLTIGGATSASASAFDTSSLGADESVILAFWQAPDGTIFYSAATGAF
jgi:hypothetical protein